MFHYFVKYACVEIHVCFFSDLYLFVISIRVFFRVKPYRGSMGYSKLHLKKKTIDTVEELVDNSIELFLDVTSGDWLYKTTVEQFIPQLIWTWIVYRNYEISLLNYYKLINC